MAVTKIPDKEQLEVRRSVLVQGDAVPHRGKAWQQECEAAGHTVSTFRKQTETEAGAQLPFSSMCMGHSPCNGTALIQVGLPSSVDLIWKVSRRHSQRLLSQVIPGSRPQ